MMAGNPSWWGMFPPSLLSPQFSLSSSSSSSSASSTSASSLPLSYFADSREHHQSWSQLLLGDEERLMNQTQTHYQLLNLNPPVPFADVVKQEVSGESNGFSGEAKREELMIQAPSPRPAVCWPQMVQASSPASSCVSSLNSHNSKFLNFSYNNNVDQKNNHSSESNSSGSGGAACKKARVHPPSSSQPPLKVRKEKLVDRITALHQIVSPFGKTDTASVLSEAIGYIRFLQGQIEALSSPYLGNNAPKHIRNPHSSLLNDPCLNRSKAAFNQENGIGEKPLKDLRSRGLCLVPVSCTQLVGSDNNGADYWAPSPAAYGSGF